jgi:hypothetical protein
MSPRIHHMLPLLLLAVSLSACNLGLPAPKVYQLPPLNRQADSTPMAMKVAAQTVSEDGVLELTWDDLVPPEWLPANILGDTKIEDLKDDDPRAIEFAAKMKELWAKAPVRKELEGKLIKLPGFVIPLESDGKKVTEFLLVPYMGACIHVPPPPANQTVYVKTGTTDAKIRRVFDTVWVTGRVKIEKIEGELATSGYTILATKIEPYQ